MIKYSKFPFKQIRPNQKKLLDLFDREWHKYKYWVIEAPTGFGKSAIAKTICSSVTDAFIITSTKQLQDQYINDFKDGSLVSIKGKANYECSLNSNLTCENGYCLVDKKQFSQCKRFHLCPYMNIRNDALNANIVLTNYQYFLRTIESSKNPKPRKVLIFDECHLIENQIVQWAQLNLSVGELTKKYRLDELCEFDEFVKLFNYPTKDGNNQETISWLRNIYRIIFKTRNKMFEEIKESLGLAKINPEDLSSDELDNISINHKIYYNLDKLYKKIDVFFKGNMDDWLISCIDDGIQITPISLKNIFSKYIDSMGIDKVIFLSATILSPKMILESLGIEDNSKIVRVHSEFDPKRSPIVYSPICRMNYKELNNNLPKIANEIKKILNDHPNEKGIIHTGNSVISKYLEDNIKSDRLLVRYGDVNNLQIIDKHLNSKKPTVLVSSSLQEGVDLKDNLSRFQIIVKLPFLNLMDKRVLKKNEINNDWYTVEMLKSFVQQCGRSTRSNNDYSVTYVLDESFKWFFNKGKNKKWLPEYFSNRVILDNKKFNLEQFNYFVNNIKKNI